MDTRHIVAYALMAVLIVGAVWGIAIIRRNSLRHRRHWRTRHRGRR